MKKEIFISSLIFAALFGCGEKENINTKKSDDTVKDSLTSVIDSIRLANMHKSFVGKHIHPGSQGNLGKHAHQNIPKKVKLSKVRAKHLPRAKRIEKLKMESRRKTLIERGIISPESKD